MPSRGCCTSQNETEEVARIFFVVVAVVADSNWPPSGMAWQKSNGVENSIPGSIKSRVIGCETICFKLMFIQHVLFCLFFSAFAPAHFCLFARGFLFCVNFFRLFDSSFFSVRSYSVAQFRCFVVTGGPAFAFWYFFFFHFCPTRGFSVADCSRVRWLLKMEWKWTIFYCKLL